MRLCVSRYDYTIRNACARKNIDGNCNMLLLLVRCSCLYARCTCVVAAKGIYISMHLHILEINLTMMWVTFRGGNKYNTPASAWILFLIFLLLFVCYFFVSSSLFFFASKRNCELAYILSYWYCIAYRIAYKQTYAIFAAGISTCAVCVQVIKIQNKKQQKWIFSLQRAHRRCKPNRSTPMKTGIEPYTIWIWIYSSKRTKHVDVIRTGAAS